MKTERVLALTALTFVTVSDALATTTYSSQASLEASTPVLTYQTVNLSAFVGVCAPCTSVTDPVTGATFTSSAPNLLTVPNSTTIRMSASGQSIQVTGLGSAQAFGVNVPQTILFQVGFTGDAASFSSGILVGPVYFGARVTSPGFTGLTFTQSSSGNLDLASFEVGTGAGGGSVPETGTLLSMAAGLLLVGIVKRRTSL